MKARVGELRQQSALAESDRPVIIISDDEALKELLAGRRLEVVEFYPDTTDGDGKWGGTFKIKVALQKPVESARDLHQRDAKRMNLGRMSPLLKTTPITRGDVGKYFVVSTDGQSARIVTGEEFAKIGIDEFDSWIDIGEFDINQ